MNAENKDLKNKISENTVKKIKKQRYYRAFLKNSIERVFNFIRFIEDKQIRFNPSFQKICK